MKRNKSQNHKNKHPKHHFLLWCCLITNFVINAQINLVPNPSFEIDTACPKYSGEILKAVPWVGTNNSTDYFKECGINSAFRVPGNIRGFQNARSGQAYAGQYSFQSFGLNYREFLQSPLISGLVSNKCYLVKFYINNANNVRYACNNYSALFTSNSFSTTTAPWPAPSTMPSYSPQIMSFSNPVVLDTLNWVGIGGVFKAVGGEKFITIGNFKPDSVTDTINIGGFLSDMAYYFIDDVSVEEISDTKKWIRDTTLHRGDSVFIGSNLGGISAIWYNLNGQQLAAKPGLFVKPNIDTKYIAHQTFCGGTYIDTILVQIIEDHVGIKKLEILNDKLEMILSENILSIQNNSAKHYNLKVFNLCGVTVFEKKNIYDALQINFNDYNNGIYFIQIENEEVVFQKKILKSP